MLRDKSRFYGNFKNDRGNTAIPWGRDAFLVDGVGKMGSVCGGVGELDP